MATPQALTPASQPSAATKPEERPAGSAADSAAAGLARRIALVLALLAIALMALLWSPPAWGASSTDVVVLQRGARLFDNHCAGCHVNGGNVIRRSKTLRRQDLLREGVNNAADVARIAADGKGQMSGYGKVLGEGGADAVGAWVWKQAELGWPRR